MKENVKTVVVGFGNILMCDEGVGIHIISELQKLYPPSGPFTPEFIDGGTSAIDVFLSLKDVNKLIIIDAMQNGGLPGTIYKFQLSTFSQLRQTGLSLHDLNIIDALMVAEKLKQLPQHITFIGIEPSEIKPSMELSSILKDKMPLIIEFIIGELSHDCFTTKTN